MLNLFFFPKSFTLFEFMQCEIILKYYILIREEITPLYFLKTSDSIKLTLSTVRRVLAWCFLVIVHHQFAKVYNTIVDELEH